MKIAVMQPYFFPYIGYFQLIQAVDAFVIYDEIKYTKKGWINRNRILSAGRDRIISLPLQQDSDALPICRRTISGTWQRDRTKLMNLLKESYRRAPFHESVLRLVERCLDHPEQNLFEFIRHSITLTCDHLGIATPIVVSSSLGFDNTLQSTEKVIAICRAMHATHYVNPIGGLDLYDREEFGRRGVDLRFLRTKPLRYPQFSGEFIPHLSIIDVMMFNAPERIGELLRQEYEIF